MPIVNVLYPPLSLPRENPRSAPWILEKIPDSNILEHVFVSSMQFGF